MGKYREQRGSLEGLAQPEFKPHLRGISLAPADRTAGSGVTGDGSMEIEVRIESLALDALPELVETVGGRPQNTCMREAWRGPSWHSIGTHSGWRRLRRRAAAA